MARRLPWSPVATTTSSHRATTSKPLSTSSPADTSFLRLTTTLGLYAGQPLAIDDSDSDVPDLRPIEKKQALEPSVLAATSTPDFQLTKRQPAAATTSTVTPDPRLARKILALPTNSSGTLDVRANEKNLAPATTSNSKFEPSKPRSIAATRMLNSQPGSRLLRMVFDTAKQLNAIRPTALNTTSNGTTNVSGA
ncbi:hypothetical protein C1H76_1517 [Elsinoe australis]|uniref:Uncharacterized protein n=1 Tax=Elsinoe australis TaxID=40998 RepID=A0A4U7BCP6_9PEZI|nr:hypothetical protein C1H76_1517 [Elsinoe australis]